MSDAGLVEREAETTLTGIAAAPGVAVGPVWRFGTERAVGAPAASGGGAPDLESAAREAADQLSRIADRVRALGREEEAEIFVAQGMMAADPSLIDAAKDRVAAGDTPVEAIRDAADTVARELAAIPDELLASRAADVRDVGERIVRVLSGQALDLPERPSVAVADDLPPSVTAEIPAGLLLGIALQGGSRTSHAAILSRALGIPAVVAVGGLLAAVDGAASSNATGVELAVDGSSGTIAISPDDATVAALNDRESRRRDHLATAEALRSKPAALADGTRVALLANIGSPEDSARAIAAGAEGVGLFRTEFLFMRRPHPPEEREQADAYRRAFEAFGPQRPVVVRLADIGGDKPIPYLDLPREDNPFLGVRAIRLAYRSRELLVTQLRAISAAGAAAGVVPHVMAPMVATVSDVRLLQSLVAEAQVGLEADGRPRAERIELGIMVEIPSAALLAPELAPLIDFMSIGTNDLTQYTLAADRGNPTLSGFQDGLQPAVLRLIRQVVAGADAAGIPVAVCGELAGDPAGALVLVGLGVDELSVDAGSLDEIRLTLASASSDDVRRLATAALGASSAEEVRALAAALLPTA